MASNVDNFQAAKVPEKLSSHLLEQLRAIVVSKNPGQALAELFRSLPGFY